MKSKQLSFWDWIPFGAPCSTRKLRQCIAPFLTKKEFQKLTNQALKRLREQREASIEIATATETWRIATVGKQGRSYRWQIWLRAH